jgi:cob(I)alamin adenosyltransferase
MKIYTRSGDEGQTSLFAGGRVDKDDARLHAYGTVDELNSMLGMVRTHQLDTELEAMLNRVQMELFNVGADLATALDADAPWVVRVDTQMVEALEQEIDRLEQELEPLKNFIVPGGSPAAAALHMSRTICRRAERWLVTLGKSTEINAHALHYLNRLSDWLFVVARAANHRAGVADVIWQSPRTQTTPQNDE